MRLANTGPSLAGGHCLVGQRVYYSISAQCGAPVVVVAYGCEGPQTSGRRVGMMVNASGETPPEECKTLRAGKCNARVSATCRLVRALSQQQAAPVLSCVCVSAGLAGSTPDRLKRRRRCRVAAQQSVDHT